jgi:hypothetical protein
MKTLHRFPFVRVSFILVLGVLLGISGCSTAHLRDAQNALKKGTQLEWSNIYSLDQHIETTLITQETPQQKYREALGIIDELLKYDVKQLSADNLLGTALLLKAICIWKIEPDKPDRNGDADTPMSKEEWKTYRKQWKTSLDSAVDAAKEAGLSIEQKRLATALPSLLVSDLTYDRIAEHTKCSTLSNSTFNTVVTDLISGEHAVVKELNALEQEVTPNNSANRIQKEKTIRELPWRLYLLEAQLTAFINYHAALNRFCTKRPPDQYKDDLIATWGRYCKALGTLPEKETAKWRAKIMLERITNKSSYDDDIKICPIGKE